MRRLSWLAVSAMMFVSLLSMPNAAQSQARVYVDPYGRYYDAPYYAPRYRSYYRPSFRHDRGLHRGWYKHKFKHHRGDQVGHWDRRYRRWY